MRVKKHYHTIHYLAVDHYEWELSQGASRVYPCSYIDCSLILTVNLSHSHLSLLDNLSENTLHSQFVIKSQNSLWEERSHTQEGEGVLGSKHISTLNGN